MATLIWTVVGLGTILCRLAEWRLHRRNYVILRHAGAREGHAQLVSLYYLVTALPLPFAAGEMVLWPTPPNSARLAAGLATLMAALALRCWAIHSLGTLWTMRCMALPGMRHLNHGPYRYVNNPEYLSRVIEILGIGLVFGAGRTVLLLLPLTVLLAWRVAASELAQVLTAGRGSVGA